MAAADVDLEGLTARAVDAAVAAGAEDAEAAAQDSVGREIRVFDGEVESLTEAGERGVGVRAWIGGRVGFAYGTDLSDAGVEGIAAAAVEAARVSDADEFAAAPEPADGDAPTERGVLRRSRSRDTHGGEDRYREGDRALCAGGRRARGRRRDDRLRRRGGALGSQLLQGPGRQLRGHVRLRLPPGDRRGGWLQADGPGVRHGPLTTGARSGGDRPRGRRALCAVAGRGETRVAQLPGRA